MDQLIEFPYCGGIVRVQVQAKAVIVNFFGQRFQFSVTKAALRERVRLEIRKAGGTVTFYPWKVYLTKNQCFRYSISKLG